MTKTIKEISFNDGGIDVDKFESRDHFLDACAELARDMARQRFAVVFDLLPWSVKKATLDPKKDTNWNNLTDIDTLIITTKTHTYTIKNFMGSCEIIKKDIIKEKI